MKFPPGDPRNVYNPAEYLPLIHDSLLTRLGTKEFIVLLRKMEEEPSTFLEVIDRTIYQYFDHTDDVIYIYDKEKRKANGHAYAIRSWKWDGTTHVYQGIDVFHSEHDIPVVRHIMPHHYPDRMVIIITDPRDGSLVREFTMTYIPSTNE